MDKVFEELLEADNTLFIFDFDGTLIECRYGSGHLCILGVINEDANLLIRDLTKNVYKEKSPIAPIYKIVEKINNSGRGIKVLTQIHNGMELMHKMEWVEYHDICEGKDVIGVINSNDKLAVLEFYCKKYDNVVYIDDNVAALILFEEHMKSYGINNCNFYHVSSLLT